MLTQLLIHVSKEEGSRGEYTNKWGPGWGKFINRRAVQGIQQGWGLDGGSGRG